LRNDPPGVRLARLGEAVHILKGFFSSADTLTFAGEHYRLTDLECFPRPVQQPRPPLMIGGRQTAHAVASRARGRTSSAFRCWNRGPNPPPFADKVGWVRDAAGARLADIELHVNVNAVEPNATPETPGAPNRLLGRSMPSASSSSTGARSTASRTSP